MFWTFVYGPHIQDVSSRPCFQDLFGVRMLKIKLSCAADSHITFPGDSRLVIWVLEFGAMC